VKTITRYDRYRRIIAWVLLAVTVLYGVSGFGITEFRIVETLTFGWLTKNLAFQIHNNLEIPFVVLLITHVCLALLRSRLNRRGC